MSLVNDALRRAQDAQKKSQRPAPGPQFRPTEPAAPEKRGMGMLVPLVIAVAAIGGFILIFHSRQKTEARQTVVDPKPVAPVVAVAETKPPVQQVAALAPAPAAVVVIAEKPALAPELKLQAIFFTPGRSSAIISGKTVRAGDNFKGFRVAAITQTSATLVSATQTNVMTLEPD
jgi:MSHA biogenesis protein MshK